MTEVFPQNSWQTGTLGIKDGPHATSLDLSLRSIIAVLSKNVIFVAVTEISDRNLKCHPSSTAPVQPAPWPEVITMRGIERGIICRQRKRGGEDEVMARGWKMNLAAVLKGTLSSLCRIWSWFTSCFSVSFSSNHLWFSDLSLSFF